MRSNSSTLLHTASLYGKAKVLTAILDHQQDRRIIDEFNEKGFTALYLAVMARDMKTVRLLLKAGADPNLPCLKKGKSPLQLAFKFKRDDNVKLLLAHPKINVSYITPTKGRNVWHYATRYCSNRRLLEILPQDDQLIAQIDYKGWAPIHRAALACNHVAILVLKNKEILTADGQTVVDLLKIQDCPPENLDSCCIIA